MPRQPHQLFDTPEQKAALEARNGLLQFEGVQRMITTASAPGTPFNLTPATLCEFHRLAIQNIYVCSGQIRTRPVFLMRNGVIDNTRHQPPPWEQVRGFVDEMCAYVNGNFGMSAIHLSAYVMWRLNWIHPFLGGNGRTSRAASYLVLCVRLGFNLPGVKTIPQQIETDRDPYYDALHKADTAYDNGIIDVSAMETLISSLLAAQLLTIHDQASGKSA